MSLYSVLNLHPYQVVKNASEMARGEGVRVPCVISCSLPLSSTVLVGTHASVNTLTAQIHGELTNYSYKLREYALRVNIMKGTKTC